MIRLSFPIFILFLICTTSSCNNNRPELTSPSDNLKATIVEVFSGLEMKLISNGMPVSTIHLDGFTIKNDTIGGNHITKIKRSSFNEEWEPVYGERNLIRNNYNEIEIELTQKSNSARKLILICRLYDEGLAFKYKFPSAETYNIRLNGELTVFNFDNDYKVWVADRAQAEYRKVRISDIKNAAERPLVIERSDSSYLALGEAGLTDFARMKFKSGKANSIVVDLASEVDLKEAGLQTPWRYIMVADSPGELLENNYFIENLNEPNKIDDTSWIKPGKVIREVTLTTHGGIACVDFAVKHNLQYVEFDAGWYGNEYDDSSDASTITVDPKRSPGPLDLHKVIDYANQNDIGIILYINRRAMEKQLDEVLPLYKSWGVRGLKYGFVNVGPQEWTSWLHEAVRKAAKYELMVDIHDEYRPTGYSRTYPNLMTQEGIRGDEESPSTEHTLTTLFTRMIAGAGDNTNCYLAPRVKDKMGGRAAQMAKSIMIYSPWQFLYWYDRPEGSPHKTGGAGAAEGVITDSEELGFYDMLPTVWDETKVLEGKIGEYATIVRKNSDNWYIGSLTSKEGRKIEIPLSFLDNNAQYEALIYKQDAEGLLNNELTIQKTLMNNKSVLSISLEENSGQAIIIRKL